MFKTLSPTYIPLPLGGRGLRRGRENIKLFPKHLVITIKSHI